MRHAGRDQVLGSLRVLGSSPSVRATYNLESKPDRFRHRFEIAWSGKLLGLRVHLLSAIHCSATSATLAPAAHARHQACSSAGPERRATNAEVRGSNPFRPTIFRFTHAPVAQLVERRIEGAGVAGSIPAGGTNSHRTRRDNLEQFRGGIAQLVQSSGLLIRWSGVQIPVPPPYNLESKPVRRAGGGWKPSGVAKAAWVSSTPALRHTPGCPLPGTTSTVARRTPPGLSVLPSGCRPVWLKPPASGAGNRRFESCHPDAVQANQVKALG
jgi:hypothetical protein